MPSISSELEIQAKATQGEWYYFAPSGDEAEWDCKGIYTINPAEFSGETFIGERLEGHEVMAVRTEFLIGKQADGLAIVSAHAHYPAALETLSEIKSLPNLPDRKSVV